MKDPFISLFMCPLILLSFPHSVYVSSISHSIISLLLFFLFFISSSFCHLMSHVFILPFIHFVSCFIHCFLNVCCIVCLQVFPRRIYHRYMVLIVHLYEIAADTSHNRTSLQGQVNTLLCQKSGWVLLYMCMIHGHISPQQKSHGVWLR